jgi:hypothetical protein
MSKLVSREGSSDADESDASAATKIGTDPAIAIILAVGPKA